MPRLALGVGHRHVLVAADAHRLGGDVLAVDHQRDAIVAGHHVRPVVAAAAEAATATTAATTAAG